MVQAYRCSWSARGGSGYSPMCPKGATQWLVTRNWEGDEVTTPYCEQHVPLMERREKRDAEAKYSSHKYVPLTWRPITDEENRHESNRLNAIRAEQHRVRKQKERDYDRRIRDGLARVVKPRSVAVETDTDWVRETRFQHNVAAFGVKMDGVTYHDNTAIVQVIVQGPDEDGLLNEAPHVRVLGTSSHFDDPWGLVAYAEALKTAAMRLLAEQQALVDKSKEVG